MSRPTGDAAEGACGRPETGRSSRFRDASWWVPTAAIRRRFRGLHPFGNRVQRRPDAYRDRLADGRSRQASATRERRPGL